MVDIVSLKIGKNIHNMLAVILGSISLNLFAISSWIIDLAIILIKTLYEE